MIMGHTQGSDNGSVLHLVEHKIIFIVFQAAEGLVYVVMVHSITHNQRSGSLELSAKYFKEGPNSKFNLSEDISLSELFSM